MWGSWDPDRQLFVHTWLEGVQAFLLKKTGVLCLNCATKEKSLIPWALKGAKITNTSLDFFHVIILFCFSLKPKMLM